MAQFGKGHGFALKGALVDTTSGAYYNTRTNLQSFRVRVNGALTEIVSQEGQINAFITTGDMLEAEFEVIPEGTTQALAFAGAKLPARGTSFNASGFGTDNQATPVITNIPIGPFTNSGINSTGAGVTDTQPWFFQDGEIAGTSTGHWTARWTMRRYFGITSGDAILA